MKDLDFGYKDERFAERLADPYLIMKQAGEDMEVHIALRALENSSDYLDNYSETPRQ